MRFWTPFDAVRGVDDAEVDLHALGKLFHRRKEIVGRARRRHRQMDVGNLVADVLHDCIRDIDEMPRRHRVKEVLAAKITVAEVKTELDIVRHRRADAHEPLCDVLLRGVHQRELILRLSVPDDHVVADVPLDAEVAVWNVPAPTSTSYGCRITQPWSAQ